MKEFLNQKVKWLDGLGAAFHSNDNEKRKTTILIRACFLAGFFMILYIGNCYFIEFKLGYIILPIESLIYFFLPFLVRAGISPKVVAHLYILNGSVFGILLVWFSGGLQSPVTPWLTLMPICAILFLDARNAWLWAIGILVVVLIMGLYWHFVKPAPINYNREHDAIYFLNCYAGLIFIYLLLSLIFEKRLNATIKELETNKISLEQSNNQLNKTIEDIKRIQEQLVQSEKLASLGELTAGIAHEIQNPLNFVNNFSDLSTELMSEMVEEVDKGNYDGVKFLAESIKLNLEKINHHGQRAGDIVKGMLQHSRTNTGQKELADINALADEYLRLSYHGLRAKDKTFNAKFESDFDNTIGHLNIVPQEIGRVILNLLNNAFYAVNERKKLKETGYEPTVIISTKKDNKGVLISIRDNGIGIPQKVLDKIFQPFFTTKPTGEGTGLGLSLSYDIIKAHGGTLSVESNKGENTHFILQFPA